MKQYAIVISPTSTGWSAYAPDLPGCVAAARTKEECMALMTDAIEFHLEDLQNEGSPVPPPMAVAERVRVSCRPDASESKSARLVQRIVALRRSAGLTQKEVAARMGVPQPRVAEIERNPESTSLSRILEYASAVGADLRVERSDRLVQEP